MSKKKATAISLPLSRTAKIMTSAVGVESVNQDIVALATKATVSVMSTSDPIQLQPSPI